MGNMFTLAAGSTAAAQTGSSSSGLLLLVAIAVLFGLYYFVFARPQRNRQRRVMQAQSQVGPGQRVRTTAGMYATVVAVDGDDVVLEIAPGVEARYMRRAIMEVLSDADVTADAAAATGEPGPDAGEDAAMEEEAREKEPAENGQPAD